MATWYKATSLTVTGTWHWKLCLVSAGWHSTVTRRSSLSKPTTIRSSTSSRWFDWWRKTHTNRKFVRFCYRMHSMQARWGEERADPEFRKMGFHCISANLWRLETHGKSKSSLSNVCHLSPTSCFCLFSSQNKKEHSGKHKRSFVSQISLLSC